MPVEIVRGDIFRSGADALVNPVNCVGTSGKGLAKQFARRFPFAQKVYVSACRRGTFQIGTVLESAHKVGGGKPRIIFFPTKDHWRDPSRREYITEGLSRLSYVISTSLYDTVAVPALGCGNGGLDWDWVCPTIEYALADLATRVLLYEPME